jgi:hypothetical protein
MEANPIDVQGVHQQVVLAMDMVLEQEMTVAPFSP